MNLLITGAWSEAKKNISALEKLGHKVEFLQYEKDKLPCSHKWVEGVICNGLFLHHQIEQFSDLKYIQLTSMGFDRVPMQYVLDNNIAIHNAKGVYSVPMAEYTVAMILNLYKRIPFFADNQKKCQWEKSRDLLELNQKKVCIVGCGNVGTECAKRFQAFGCKVIGVDICLRKDPYYDQMVKIEQLDEILTISDIIVLTLPLTAETKHLMDNNKFEVLKKGAILVNISRGGIIDTDALKRNIDNLSGVILDVFETEPLKANDALWNIDKVIITPHNSFVGEYNAERLEKVIFDNLKMVK